MPPTTEAGLQTASSPSGRDTVVCVKFCVRDAPPSQQLKPVTSKTYPLDSLFLSPEEWNLTLRKDIVAHVYAIPVDSYNAGQFPNIMDFDIEARHLVRDRAAETPPSPRPWEDIESVRRHLLQRAKGLSTNVASLSVEVLVPRTPPPPKPGRVRVRVYPSRKSLFSGTKVLEFSSAAVLGSVDAVQKHILTPIGVESTQADSDQKDLHWVEYGFQLTEKNLHEFCQRTGRVHVSAEINLVHGKGKP
jgi:hypothetical protein